MECDAAASRFSSKTKVKRMHMSSTVAATALALLITTSGAFAQTIPSVVPDALAAQLQASGIDAAAGFAKGRALNCMRGSAKTDWAYHCVATFTDSARAGRVAPLEIMIFNNGYDFASKDAQIKAAVMRLNGLWSLDHESAVNIKNAEHAISLTATCHQSRGKANSPAYCLLPVAQNVLVFSQVWPAEPSSERITTDPNGGSDSFDDMARAGFLASLGALAVVKAQRPADTINHASEALLR